MNKTYNFHAEHETHPDWLHLHARRVQEGHRRGYADVACVFVVGMRRRRATEFCCQVNIINKELSDEKTYDFGGCCARPPLLPVACCAAVPLVGWLGSSPLSGIVEVVGAATAVVVAVMSVVVVVVMVVVVVVLSLS